jgi:hypothetical protein
LAASFSTTFIRGEARWTPHPLKDRGDDDRYAVPATDLSTELTFEVADFC